jgi:hypothetical protein
MTVFLSATAMAAAMTLNAQTPTPQTPQTPTTQPQTDRQRTGTDTQRTGMQQQAVTVTGCLKEEKDVPGRQPNMAERAGMGEDYILTNVKMGQGSKTSAIGLSAMYQVKGIDDSELKKHLNHQVEVMGQVSGSANGSNMGASRGATGTTGTTGSTMGTTGTTGTTGQRAGTTGASGAMGNNHDLPELQATSIRMIAQTCPANQ